MNPAPPKGDVPTTPTKTQPKRNPDTPLIRRTAHNAGFLHGSVDVRRTAVLTDIPDKIRELPIEDFEKYVLPKSKFTKKDLDEIYPNIEPLISKVPGKSIVWRALDHPELSEPKRYMDFQKVEEHITSAAETYSKRIGRNDKITVGFTSDGNKTPNGPWPERARPDGTSFLRAYKHQKNPGHWANVHRVDEYKLANNDKASYDVSIPTLFSSRLR
jgi:hypothetical protein